MKSDTEIADSTVLEEIDTIARKASIPVENLFHYGPYTVSYTHLRAHET